MKKLVLFVLTGAAALFCLTSCGSSAGGGTKSAPGAVSSSAKAASSQVQTMTVTSSSIDSSGKLSAETAGNTGAGNPGGPNKSPQVSWNAVDGATCYAVCMYDDDAGWLHWFVSGIKTTSLNLGAYTDHEHYVGPYPPKNSGIHHYHIEIFALKQDAAGQIAVVDGDMNYVNFVGKLDKAGGKTGNILAKGSIVGTYENGQK